MNADLISVLLGAAAIAVVIGFFIWRSHVRKAAARQLEEDFLKEGYEHER